MVVIKKEQPKKKIDLVIIGLIFLGIILLPIFFIGVVPLYFAYKRWKKRKLKNN